MNNINYENFKNICRMCMLDCDTNFNKDFAIMDIFHKLTDIHFEKIDELPQQICLKCFDFLNEIHAFSVKCKHTHSVLMECLINYKNKQIKQEPQIIEETIEDVEQHNEVTIEEHKIEFVKVEPDIDWETNDQSNEEVTDDLLTPISSPKYEHPTVPKIMISKKMKNSSFKCDQCEKSYNQSNDLLKHMRVHSGERPYKCDQCDKTFTQSSILTRHKRVHSNERPFECDQCKTSFKHLHDLTTHKRVHSGDRPYKCDQCKQSFKRSYHLIRHKRIMHSSKHSNKM